MNQRLVVYGHLRKGPLTPLQALRLYGVSRLSARILELKRSGFRIVTESAVVKTRHGSARVARYRLCR